MPDEFSLSGWRSTKPTLGYGVAELNQYGVKSFEAYLLGRVRGNVNNKAGKYDAAYFALFDRNEEKHMNVTRHAQGVKRKMAQILSDLIMRDLQDKALEFHAKRVEMLRIRHCWNLQERRRKTSSTRTSLRINRPRAIRWTTRF